MAVINVNELGTEAAAVTDISMDKAAFWIEEPQLTFIVDHPFMYFIQDVETGTILFMGSVSNL